MVARRHDKEKIELMQRVPVSKAILKLAFPVFMVIQAVGNIFGSGVPSYISRCLGAGQEEKA